MKKRNRPKNIIPADAALLRQYNDRICYLHRRIKRLEIELSELHKLLSELSGMLRTKEGFLPESRCLAIHIHYPDNNKMCYPGTRYPKAVRVKEIPSRVYRDKRRSYRQPSILDQL